MLNYIEQNNIYYLILLITDNDGNGVPSASISYTIYKSSDDSVIDTGTLTEIGNGVYKDSYSFSITGQYYVVYTTPSEYTNEIETINVTEKYAKESSMLRTLGLSDENKKILNTVHDINGNLLSATVKIYASATDFENDTNTLAIYEFTATYNASNLMENMGIKRIS